MALSRNPVVIRRIAPIRDRLQKFLLTEWRSYTHSANSYFTFNLTCVNVNSGKCETHFAAASPCEADTRAFFQATRLEETCLVVFDFEDTDVWMIASYISHLTEQSMYMLRKKSGDAPLYYRCRAFFPDQETASVALGVYALLVWTLWKHFLDGKVSIMKRTLKCNDMSHMETMQRLGMENE